MKGKFFASAMAAAVIAAFAAVLPSGAGAQTTGTNGQILFVSFNDATGGNDIYRTNPGSNTSTPTGLGFRDINRVDACHTDPNLALFDGEDELGGQRGLWTVDVTDASTLAFVDGTQFSDGAAVWNFDCSLVAFQRNVTSDDGGIFLKNLSTPAVQGPLAGTRRADNGGSTAGQAPEWSPDNQRIYFHVDIDPSGTEVNQIFSVNSNGGDRQQTVASGDGNCGVAGDTTTSCQNVSIRGDNQLVAFEKGTTGTTPRVRVFTASRFQGFPSQVAQSQDLDQSPDWSPDGTDIVVKAAGTGLAILAFDVQGGNRTAFNPNGNRAATFPDWAHQAQGGGGQAPTPTPVPTASPPGGGGSGGSGGSGGFGGFGGFGGLFGGGGFGGLFGGGGGFGGLFGGGGFGGLFGGSGGSGGFGGLFGGGSGGFGGFGGFGGLFG